ncbi:unnamed protein product [Ectocarpus sp. 13 AM-2016]
MERFQLLWSHFAVLLSTSCLSFHTPPFAVCSILKYHRVHPKGISKRQNYVHYLPLCAPGFLRQQEGEIIVGNRFPTAVCVAQLTLRCHAICSLQTIFRVGQIALPSDTGIQRIRVVFLTISGLTCLRNPISGSCVSPKNRNNGKAAVNQHNTPSIIKTAQRKYLF